jgi:tetratricopeptide (TPR) repeat protein
VIELIAGIHLRRGDIDRATAFMEEVLQGRTAVYGAEHPEVARGHANLGLALVEARRHEQAIPHLDRARAIFDAIDSKARVRTINAAALVLALRAAGRAGPELRRAETALAQALDRSPPEHAAVAEMSLAEGLWVRGLERKRAIQLARSARDRWRKVGAEGPATEAEDWLAKHAP